jgi:hypothetical protein
MRPLPPKTCREQFRLKNPVTPAKTPCQTFKIPEKPQNEHIKPEGKIRHTAKIPEKQALFDSLAPLSGYQYSSQNKGPRKHERTKSRKSNRRCFIPLRIKHGLDAWFFAFSPFRAFAIAR